jgi:hypothetical protein
VLVRRWAGSALLLRTLMLMLGSRWIGGVVVVHRLVLRRGTTRWSGHNLPLLSFLVARMASSTIMTLLTNSRNVPSVLSAKRSYSLVERPIMKRSFFFSSVSTWSSAYYAKWLNCLE